MTDSPQPWCPTTFLRFERGFNTSMGTARIITDAGPAYIKAMGNRQGPHCLACEWVGTQLARWFGLPTFDFAIMNLEEADEVPFIRGGKAAPGPAFVSRAADGRAWSGTDADLDLLDNPEALSWLVVFDTWTLNCDRHPADLATRRPNKDNVFLVREGATQGHYRLIAMDHTHCFTCGRDLTDRMADIDHVKDERLYGLFPVFLPRLLGDELKHATDRLRTVNKGTFTAIVESVPREWDVSQRARKGWNELLYKRAQYVAETIADRLRQLTDAPSGEPGQSPGGAPP
jgi:hypothetical protein